MKAVWCCMFGDYSFAKKAYSNSLFHIQYHTAFQNALNKYDQVYYCYYFNTIGILTVKEVPLPRTLITEILPLCFLIIS